MREDASDEHSPFSIVLEHGPNVNRRLARQSRVGSLAVQDLYAENPSWRRLALRSYPWVDRCPDHLVEAAAAAAREPWILPPLGLKPLRDRLALELARDVGTPVDLSVIAVTNGAQAALQSVWFALLNYGDEVLVPVPNYYVEGAISLAGGVFCPVPAMSAKSIDWDQTAAAIGPSTKALFLTNPNNPIGYLLGAADVAVAETLLEMHRGLWLVVDESYERIRHDGRPHLPVWTSPILRERSVMIRSFSKSYALSWLRVGWLAAPAKLIPFLLKAIEWQQLYGSCLNQAVALAVLEGNRHWLEPAFRGFSEGRDLLHAALTNVDGCRLGLPQAGPFLFPDIGGLKKDYGAVIADLRRNGIAAVEGRYFGVEAERFRMPVGGDAETLSAAASIITATLGG